MIINEWIEITDDVKPPLDVEVVLWDETRKKKAWGSLAIIPVLSEVNYFIEADLAEMDATLEEMRDYYSRLNITRFFVVPD